MMYVSASVHIQSLGPKGLGVVAAEDIPAGVCVMAESPMVSTYLQGRAYGPCEACLAPTLVHPEHGNTILYCERACGALYCSDVCFHAAHNAHLCPNADSLVRTLQCHALWRAPRFRLYCKAVSQLVTAYATSSVQGGHYSSFLNSFACPNLSVSPDIRAEFDRRVQPGIEMITEILRITDASNADVRGFASIEGYWRFWSVCSANAHEIRYPQYEITGTALFQNLRRLNHSCHCSSVVVQVANSSGKTAMFGAVTVRSVRAGEEISIDYFEGEGRPKSRPDSEDHNSERGQNGATEVKSDSVASAAQGETVTSICRGHELKERYGFVCSCVSK